MSKASVMEHRLLKRPYKSQWTNEVHFHGIRSEPEYILYKQICGCQLHNLSTKKDYTTNHNRGNPEMKGFDGVLKQ